MIATKLHLPTALCLLAQFTCSAWAQEAVESSQEIRHYYPDNTWERWEDPSASGYSQEALDKLRSDLKAIDSTGMMVVVNGKVLFEYGDLEQVSYVASVRKSILAMLYGKYVTDTSIDLDITLEDLDLDDVQGLLEIEKQATIEDLITARSGIYHPASNPGDNTDQAPERGSQVPGEYFLYNNWDFNAARLGLRDPDREEHLRRPRAGPGHTPRHA